MLSTTASRKLLGGFILLIVLTIGLCLTTYALVDSMISTEDNVFQTGMVSIDLNDGNPVFDDPGLLFAPGMSDQKTFLIKNQSTCPVYFRIYFENVTGALAPHLDVTIADGEDVLYSGKADGLTRKDAKAANTQLMVGEKRELTITFHFPKECDSILQNQIFMFDLCADAVQSKNNPDKQFD